MNQNTCKTCIFMVERQSHYSTSMVMECRRFPPQWHGFDRSAHCEYPLILESEWCGEWKENPKPQPQAPKVLDHSDGDFSYQCDMPHCRCHE